MSKWLIHTVMTSILSRQSSKIHGNFRCGKHPPYLFMLIFYPEKLKEKLKQKNAKIKTYHNIATHVLRDS
jgi:hypothetical protein